MEENAKSASAVPAWETLVAQLVAERGSALERYAFLLCGNPEDAADIVQDALVKTFGRLRNGFGISSAEAYVRKAILNTYLDRGRRTTLWRRVAHLEVAAEIHEPAAASDVHIDLQVRLSALSPRERACVVLRYYEDLKVDDIAHLLNISTGAVKRYLSDALRKLAVAMFEENQLGQTEGDTRVE